MQCPVLLQHHGGVPQQSWCLTHLLQSFFDLFVAVEFIVVLKAVVVLNVVVVVKAIGVSVPNSPLCAIPRHKDFLNIFL